eukprot:jgi/Mesvir1/24465/Mv21829-RA.1
MAVALTAAQQVSVVTSIARPLARPARPVKLVTRCTANAKQPSKSDTAWEGVHLAKVAFDACSVFQGAQAKKCWSEYGFCPEFEYTEHSYEDYRLAQENLLQVCESLPHLEGGYQCYLHLKDLAPKGSEIRMIAEGKLHAYAQEAGAFSKTEHLKEGAFWLLKNLDNAFE